MSGTRIDGEVIKAFEYDPMGRLSRELDGEGVRTTYLYQQDGRLSHRVRQHVAQAYANFGERSGSQIARHVTRYEYDERGNVIHQSVAKDYRAGTRIEDGDTREAVTSSRVKYASQWQRKYDHRGRMVSETNGEGVERVTDYVAGGRIKTVRLSGAVQERIEMDALGRTLSLTNGAGEKTEYEYDDVNHRVTVVSPGGIRTVTEKNAHGETVTITDGLGHQRGFEYNAQGKVTRTTFLAKGDDEPQTLSSNEYHAQTGPLTFSTNADGTRTEYRYDALGRQWKVIQDADGEKLTTTYAYNADGQRISENREGRVTTLRFDSQGRKIWAEQGGVGTEYTYDLDGRIIEQVEGALAANGQIQQERVTEYERDVLGAVLEKRVRSGQNWSGRASNRSVSYRYNAAGQVIEKQTGRGSISRTVYDAQGRVQYVINALNYVTAYEYDAANRKIQTTRYAKAIAPMNAWTVESVNDALSGSGRVTEHRYDESGRLAFDIDGLHYATGYEYDAANRVIRTTRYAKPVTDSDWLAASPNNRINESIYDEKGQLRFSISETGAVTERGYDVMGRVTHTIRYDQPVSLQGRSDAEVAAFKAALSQEVQAGRVRSELSVFDVLGRLVFEMDGEGYLVEYQYNRHSEKTRQKVYVNNEALSVALEVVRQQDSTLEDGAAIRLALSRLASADIVSDKLNQQLATLSDQQARIDNMKQSLAELSSGIARTHAENGVLGNQLSGATQRLNRLYQEASLEAARQETLARDIVSLQGAIRQEEQALIRKYEVALGKARTAKQSAQSALSREPNNEGLRAILTQATEDEASAQARLSSLKSQIAANPFTSVEGAEPSDFEPSLLQVSAYNPTFKPDVGDGTATLDDVDGLSDRAEQHIEGADGKQVQAQQSVVANRATVEALRKELESLSAAMQAQFDALSEQRAGYDALQVTLAQDQSRVEARQAAFNTRTIEFSQKSVALSSSLRAVEAAETIGKEQQTKVRRASSSEQAKFQGKISARRHLSAQKEILSQAEQDRERISRQLAETKTSLGPSLKAQKSAINSLKAFVRNGSNRSKAMFALTMTGGGQSGELFGPRIQNYITNRVSGANFTKSELEQAKSSYLAMFSNNGSLNKDFTKARSISVAKAKLTKFKAMLSHVHRVSSAAPRTFPNWPNFPIPSELMTYQEAERDIYEHIGMRQGRQVVTNIRNTMLIGSFDLLKNSASTGISKINALLTKLQEIERINESISSKRRQINNLESALSQKNNLVTQASQRVNDAERAVQAAQRAHQQAINALTQARRSLSAAYQAFREAEEQLSQARRAREASQALLSEARTHLEQAQADKLRTETELLAARTTLNQASIKFGQAHQSLSRTAQSLQTARQHLGDAVALHGEVNVALTQAHTSTHQASEAIEQAQQQVHLARYTTLRQAKADIASNDTDYEYDARGRLITERSAIVSYADVQKEQAVTQFIGRLTTRHAYDSLGNVLRTTKADGTRLQNTQSFTYDVEGHQVQAQGLAGNQVVYNGQGLASININAEGARRDRVYDAAGQLRFDVDELGYITEHCYNGYGEKIEQRRYAKAYTTARQPGQSLSVSALSDFTQKGGDWRQVSEAYNARGERVAVTQSSSVDAHTLTERTEFNRFGERVSVSKHYDGELSTQVKHLYSVTGQRLASLNEENYLTLYGYNGLGELSEEKILTHRYQGEWRLSHVDAWVSTQTSAQAMRRITYGYDARGHRHQVTRHNVTFSAHDGDRVSHHTDDLVTTTYHDYAGRVTMTVEEVGAPDASTHSSAANRITQEYDALGRLVSTWGKARDYVVSGLAIAGQTERPARLRAHQRVDYLYDAQGNQVATLTEGRQSFQYFSVQGQLTGRENALGHYTQVESDLMNRVIRESTQVKVGEGLAYTHQRTTEYAYDATGRQTGTTVKAASGDITESAQYNAFGEVTEKHHNATVQECYRYNGLGRVTEATRQGIQSRYQYDGQGQVTQDVTGEKSVHREYDRLGHLLREESTAFGGKLSVTTQQFDRFGQVRSRVVNGQTTHFTYNHAGQVTRVTAPATRTVDSAGQVTSSSGVSLMYYDAQGHRIAVQDANGQWQKSYYDMSGQKLMDVNGSGDASHYYHDALGNRVARVNNAGQGEMFDFDAQGQLLSRSRLSADRTYAELYVRYAYDQVGQRYLEEWQGESGYRTYTQYDAAGRITETQGEGTHRRYEYNTLGQKTAEHWLEDGTIQATKRAAYNAMGRVTQETWLNGQVIVYEYDDFGRVTRKYGGDLDQRFVYDRSGLLAQQTVGGKSETYVYDVNGRETQRVLKEGEHRLNTHTQWDAMGRIHTIKATEARAFGESLAASEVRYDYDAVGNRRKVVTVKGEETQTRWYHYDGDNRMVGSHTRTQDVATVAIGGHDGSRIITYNALGQKVKEVRWANTSREVYYRQGRSSQRDELVKTETLTGYDENGHLNQVNEFEYAGRQRVKVYEMQQRNARMGHAIEQESSRYEYRYWSATHQAGATARAEQSSVKDEKVDYFYWDGQLTSQHIDGRSDRSRGFRGQYDTHMTYHYSGQLSEQRTTNLKSGGVVDTQAYTYQAKDAFRKSTLTVGTTRRAWGRSYEDGKTEYHYNPAGHLQSVTSTKSASERKVLSDFEGQIALQLNDGQLTAELSSGGNPLAHVSNKIDADLMDEKASTVGQQPGSYVVSANDTLQRVSQRVYGDSRYWYLLADANGVSPSEPLVEGKRLVVPNQHTQTFNGAESFKPYNESEVLGNISPDPIAPPPPKKSCNPVAMIVMTVVAVVVTVYTAGAAAPMISGVTGAAVGSATGMAAGMAALAGGASVGMSAGVAMGAAAIGGAMGSVASQLVGKAMGVVDDFSWGQVAMGSFAAAAAAGVGRYLSGGWAATPETAKAASAAQQASFVDRLGTGLVRCTASYGTQYLGAKALGGEMSFNWTNFAASVVGNAASHELSFSLGEGSGSHFTSGWVGAAASSVLRGESLRANAGRFALDAFGNTLGNALVKERLSNEKTRAEPFASTKAPRKGRVFTEQYGTQPLKDIMNKNGQPTTIVTPLSAADDPSNWNFQEEDLTFATHVSGWDAQLEHHFGELALGVSGHERSPGPWRDGYVLDERVPMSPPVPISPIDNSGTNTSFEFFSNLNERWAEQESEHPVLAQAFSRQALPQTVTGIISDATSGLVGSLRTQVKIGNVSYSEPYKKVRFTHVHNPTPSFTEPALLSRGVEKWNAASAVKMAHGLGEFSQSAKTGGVIGSVMAPAGTVLHYVMDDSKDMASAEFAHEIVYNTGKGVISGYVAGAAGAAVTALAVASAPAWLAASAGIAAGVGVGMLVSEGIDYTAQGIRSGLDSFNQYGAENWGW
ncbi:LysM domain-containing protein [Vibrio chagasii]|nr:LysM domain-containing protein [Vibrio chagasii]